MAKLTSTLSTPNSGMETQAPVKPGPGLFESILSVANVVQSGLSGAADTRRQMAASERQRRLDARQALEDAKKDELETAQDELASGLLNIGRPPIEEVKTFNLSPAVHPSLEGMDADGLAAVKDAAGSGKQIQRLETAVNQGRMSRAAYEVQVETLMRDLFSRYPTARAEIFETLEKYKISHPMLSEYRQVVKVEENRLEAEEKRDEEFISTAAKYGYVEGDRAKLIARGIELTKADLILEQTLKRASEARAQGTYNQGQVDRAEEAMSDGLSLWVETKLAPGLNDTVETLTSFALNDQIPIEQRVKDLMPIVAQFQNKGRQVIDQNILEARSRGMKEDQAEALRKRMYGLLDQAVAPFSPDNPANIMRVQTETLKMMQTRSGMAAEEALPLFSQLRRTFGSMGDEALQGFVDTVFANPKTAAALAREMRGFQGLQDGDQTIRLKNALAVITDQNTQLRDLTPEQGAVALNDAKNFLDKTFPSALSGNSRSEYLALNALGKIANVGVDQTAFSSLGSLATASQYIADNKTYNLIRQAAKNPEHKELAGLVADASRVAIQKNIIALRQKAAGDPYYRIVYDIGARKFIAKPTGKQGPKPIVERGMGSQLLSRTPAPSRETIMTVGSLNRNMEFLMATTDFDDGKLAQANAAERAKFYATGEVPTSAKQEGSKVPTSSELISRLGKFWDDVDVDWDKVQEFDPNTTVDRRMGAAIERAENSTGNPAARNPNSSAMGNGQFIKSTWLDMIRRHAPELAQG